MPVVFSTPYFNPSPPIVKTNFMMAIHKEDAGEVFRGININASGDIYSAGNSIFDGTVVKVTPSGTKTWDRLIQSNNGNTFVGGVDGSDNAIVGATVSSNAHIYKFSSAGSLEAGFPVQYTDSVGAGLTSLNENVGGQPLTVSSGGDIFFGGNSASRSPQAGFVVKLNGSGVLQWAVDITATQRVDVLRVEVDGSGNVYVAGNCRTGSTIDTQLVFVSKLSSTGTEIWTSYSNDVSTNQQDELRGMVVDGSGNVIIATKAGLSDSHVIKFDSNGANPVQRRFGSNDPVDLAVDGSGDIYIALEDGLGSSVIKYNAALSSVLWQRSFASDNDTLDIQGITTDGTDYLVSGQLQTSNAKTPDYDGFIFRLKGDGSDTGVYQIVSNNTVNITYAVDTIPDNAGTNVFTGPSLTFAANVSSTITAGEVTTIANDQMTAAKVDVP